MSFRLWSSRLFKQSRYVLQWYCKRDIFTILEHGRNRGIPTTHLQKTGGQQNQPGKSHVALRTSSGLFRFGQHARKLFIDNILNRVTSSYSTELRAQATKKLFYGDSAPFFALVGVSLASGTGVLTKEDELEGVCWEIREAASRIQHTWNKEELTATLNERFTLDDLDIGPPIAKGCAAVVYAASFKSIPNSQPNPTRLPASPPQSPVDLPSAQQRVTADSVPRRDSLLLNYQSSSGILSPVQGLSRFVHNFGGSVDNLFLSVNTLAEGQNSPRSLNWRRTINEANGEAEARQENINTSRQEVEESSFDVASMEMSASSESLFRYPLALKMMFNYDIQSNAMSILRAMYKETIPARYRPSNQTSDAWEKLLQDQTLTLPPHPNIVLMFGYFCAEVRNLIGGRTLYPMAQPPRINPQGYGRNMSLYLLMKRYDCSLRSYLDSENTTMRTRILLFTQLLEAIAHLARHGVAHRDLKSDNILLDLSDDNSPPVLVLSDFGCCLADKVHGLNIPYSSYDMDKGGNTALMAPEIINKTPGTFSFLNYAKSDLWACGSIAYEIFGLANPFYSVDCVRGESEAKSLRNVDYCEEDLPELGTECPYLVKKLVTNILSPNPSRRLSPDVAANVMQLFLWAPSSWLKPGGMPPSPEILQWLLSLTTKVMCEGRQADTTTNIIPYKMGRRTYTEYLLICSFLARVKLRRLRGALSWIQSTA